MGFEYRVVDIGQARQTLPGASIIEPERVSWTAVWTISTVNVNGPHGQLVIWIDALGCIDGGISYVQIPHR